MRGTHRLVAGLAAVVVVPAVLALPVLTTSAPAIHPVTPEVAAIPLSGIDRLGLLDSVTPAVTVSNLALPLAPAVVTAATSTAAFTLVGVDWRGAAPPGTTVQVRVHGVDGWSHWSVLAVEPDHGPDTGSAEALAAGVRSGAEPLLTDPGSDGVQVRIDSAGGVAPSDARITLIDPQTSGADADAGIVATALSTAQAAGDPLRPAIITRAQWGADESMRTSAPVYTGSVKVGFVHHTASTSNYTPAQATAQVRAIYAYFTKGLHYSDIAYNFLVDRFGRLYEGRAGGMAKNVLGGHTAGFNQNTFAVSALGNFDTFKPGTTAAAAIASSIAKLMAWKLALNHRNPLGVATLISNSGAGTSRYAVGAPATVPVISGHRDIGSTACPGRYLEPFVPKIRTLARAYMGTQLLMPALVPSVTPYGASGGTLVTTTTTPVSWKLEIFSVCQSAPVRVLTGTQAAAGVLRIYWNQKRADGSAALPGTYRLVLSASNGAAVAYPVDTPMVVTEIPGSPMGPCAQVSRLAETERYAAAVHAGGLSAPSSTTIVLAPGEDAGLAEALIAAPLAAIKNAPRLLTMPTALPAAVETDIKARAATTVYLVGSVARIDTAVETQLRSLGVTTIVRLTGADIAETAAAVADEMGVRGRAVAVSFEPGASADLATAAAADAAAARIPVVVVGSTTVPTATSLVLGRLAVTEVTVAGTSGAISDGVLAAIPGAVRITGADDVARAAALVAALAPSADRISAMPLGALSSRAVAAGAGRPLLLAASSPSALTAWLVAHAQVTHVLAIAPVATWSESTLGAIAAAMVARPVPAATATAPPTATAPAPPTAVPTAVPLTAAVTPVVPASFTFFGSGYGHGVGMSQYGARGMALEGSSGSQIVRHYYSGTTVAAVPDAFELKVNLLHQQPIVVVRPEAVAAGGGGIEVTVAGLAAVVGGPTDVITVAAGTGVAAGTVIVTRTRAGVASRIGTGASVRIRWAGTRQPGKAGTAATLVNVATSWAGFASSGHRYRYGVIDIATTTAATTKVEVVNQVRLHDEYLLGIAEMSSSWPAAALQAQVLASRTYALARYGSGTARALCACHVDDGGGPYYDQVFAGWVKESGASGTLWRAAVTSTLTNSTTALAILSGGKPITAYYFAASGGATQNSQDVWVSSLAYAKSIDDHWSLDPSVPWSTWLPRLRTQAAVALAFGLADVVRIDLSSRTVAGGVSTATAWSSSGASASIRGETLRSRLSLPSTWVWRAVETASADAATSAVRASQASTSTSTLILLAPIDSPALIAVASNLSVQKGWPLLLTSSAGLPAVTSAELLRRKATRVYIVGTPSEIPDAVLTEVSNIVGIVSRYSGANDTEMSVNIAANVLARPVGTPVMVASASDPVSATLAGAAAAASGRALVLVPGAAVASASVTAFLAAALPSQTYVVGPTSSIADTVLSAMTTGVRVVGSDVPGTSMGVLATLGQIPPGHVILATETGTTSGMLAAPGVPVMVVGTSLSAIATTWLQGGVNSLTVGADVSLAVVTAARRA